MECDPGRCPDNGQNHKVIEGLSEKRQGSMDEPTSKSTPSYGRDNVKRKWAPQELVCPSSLLTTKYDTIPRS
jgi:hypothetical protein